jgi:aspartokinase
MELFEIFPLKITRSLVLLGFMRFPAKGNPSRILFDYFREIGIASQFLAEGSSDDDSRDLLIVLPEKDFRRCEADLEALRSAMTAESFAVERPVSMIRILGPHFDIRPGVASLLFSRLAKDDIKVLANSTTITTSLLIIHEDQLEQTVRALNSIFRLPHSK